MAESQPVQVFQTVTLGKYRNADAYLKALKAAGCRLGESAVRAIKSMAISEEQTQVDVVAPSIADLGGEVARNRDEMYAFADSCGLQVCPAEVGPALRLAYPDQPPRDWIIVGMEPFMETNPDADTTGPHVFGVVHDHIERSLKALVARDDAYMHSRSYHWVFVQPRIGSPPSPQTRYHEVMKRIELRGPLLRVIDTVSMGPVARFSAAETFGAEKCALMVYDDFRDWLHDRTEESIPAATLNVFALTRNAKDRQILEELGDRAETSLAHVWAVATRQANGERGVLQKGWNIFYVRDSRSVLCAVRVGFQEGCCPSIHAGDVHGTHLHHPEDSRFFSR